MANEHPPVVFVHGLWLHATSWTPWIERFAQEGYDAVAPGWPGEPDTIDAARKAPDAVAGSGIEDVVRRYASVIKSLSAPPIVIGHSFGGLIAQRLLSDGHAAAAVAIDSAPIKGVIYLPPSALRVASIGLRNPANRKRAVALTREQFRYGFANAVSQQESDTLYDAWNIPSPMRPLFEAATANFAPHSPAKVDTKKAGRGPLLLTAGGQDHTVPPSIIKTTTRLYRKSPAVTDYVELPDRGHSLTVDSGWPGVADRALDWLTSHT
ncbi:MAG: alpha/beta fold hydrolase [Nocardioidaceae bacterium]